MDQAVRPPPLPEGPYLVVGLARSGAGGGADAVRRAGRRSPGSTRGLRPRVRRARRGGGRGPAWTRTASSCSTRVALRGQEPRGAARGAGDRARRASAASPVIGELELAWRLLPNRFVAVTGTNGKTTVTELLGHIWRTAGEPVAVAGNVGTPLASLVGEVDPEATVVCECSSFQLEDSEAFAPECAVLLNVDARPPRPPRTTRRLPAREAADLRQPGQRRRRRLQRRRAGAARPRPRRLRPAGRLLPRLGPGLRGLARRGRRSSPTASRCSRRRAGPARRPQRRQRDGRRRRGPGDGPRPRRGRARACAASPASRTGSSGSPSSAASSTSTTPRRPTSPRPRPALRSFDGGVHAILGGSLKGERLRGARGAGRRALRRLLPDRRGRRAARARPGARPRRRGGAAAAAATSPTPSARRRPTPRPGEVVLLSPACASFDAYRDFEQRGEHFRELVEGLEARAATWQVRACLARTPPGR